MIRNFWTKEEDDILIVSKTAGLTYKEIQEQFLPIRTVNSVRVRGAFLIKNGSLVSNRVRINSTWTIEQEQQLVILRLNEIPYKNIAKILGRTESSIKNKVSLLSKPIKEFNNRKENILRAIKLYPSKNKYSGRLYYAYDIPHFQEIREVFGSWEEAKKEAKICVLDNTPTILYYIKIIKDTNIFYKIGITTKSVKHRFSNEKNISIVILKEKLFNSRQEARNEESLILKTFKKYRGNLQVLDYGGNSEVFNIDVLNLDG